MPCQTVVNSGTVLRIARSSALRNASEMVADLIARVSPDAHYGKDGPGHVYNPDDRLARPRSAPAYSMGSSRRNTPVGQDSRCRTPWRSCGAVSSTRSAPPQEFYRHEVALGCQRDSRRKTARASSFSRSARFAGPKEVTGQLTEECKRIESCFDRRARVGRNRRSTSATFGTATREGHARAAMCRASGDRQSCSARPRMPHPTVPSRQVLLRYGCGPEQRPCQS